MALSLRVVETGRGAECTGAKFSGVQKGDQVLKWASVTMVKCETRLRRYFCYLERKNEFP